MTFHEIGWLAALELVGGLKHVALGAVLTELLDLVAVTMRGPDSCDRASGGNRRTPDGYRL